MRATNGRQRPRWTIWLAAIAWYPAVALAAPPASTSDREPPFVTGAALEAQLRGVVSVSWSKISLRQALASLSKTEHLAIFLDRRADPDRELQLALPREPLDDILRKVAGQARLGYCQVGPVAYFGPLETTKRLRTVAQLRLDDARGLSKSLARTLTQTRSLRWDELAEPRDIVADLVSEAGLSLANPERMPHDLWPAGALPPLPWTDRLTIVLAGFDLTFELDERGRTVTLVPFPERASLTRTHRAPRQTEELARRFSEDFPQAQVVAERGTLRVEGSLEDHEAIERRLQGTPPRRTSPTAGKEVYQVAIESAPLNQVLDQLAERLSLEFQWDREAVERAKISRQQLVSVNVSNADVDALLQAVFRNTGLGFARQGRVVRVFPSAAGDLRK